MSFGVEGFEAAEDGRDGRGWDDNPDRRRADCHEDSVLGFISKVIAQYRMTVAFFKYASNVIT